MTTTVSELKTLLDSFEDNQLITVAINVDGTRYVLGSDDSEKLKCVRSTGTLNVVYITT